MEKAHSIVELVSTLDGDGFYTGRSGTGSTGLVPSNYLQLLTSQPNTASIAIAVEPLTTSESKLTIKTHKLNGLTVAWHQIRKRVQRQMLSPLNLYPLHFKHHCEQKLHRSF